jgi:Excalibur calcium-binding domain
MRRRAFLLIAALVLALSAAPAALAQDGDKDCADFASQAEAQAYFEANGGSPTNNVDNLDADHDGQACEDFDYGDGTGGDGTGGDGTGGGGTGGGALPFTGPNDTLLPASTALLLAGLALLGVTRYRARHARR